MQQSLHDTPVARASIIIRRACPDDLDAIAQVEAACFPPQEAASRETLAARMAVFGEWFFVAEVDGEVVGLIDGMTTDEETIDDAMFADAGLHRPQGAVQTVFGLCVLPPWRGSGAAGRLMQAYGQAARAAGRRKVTLTCKRERAAMYAHWGFVLRGVSRSVHGGAQWLDMDWSLT